MTQQLRSPGIASAFEQTSGGAIQGANLGVAFFIIVAQKGEVGKITKVINPADAQAKLGDYVPGYYGRKAIDVAFGRILQMIWTAISPSAHQRK